MGKTCLRKFTAGLVIIAFLLQAASIAAPGWLIEVEGNLETGHSLFYRHACNVLGDESNCVIKSFRESYSRQREELIKHRVSRKTVAEYDLLYNTLVCKQTLMVVAVSLSLLGVLVQVALLVRSRKHNVKLRVLSAVLAAISAGIVLTVVCYEIVNIYFTLELKSMDTDRDHTYVGFPYCLGMLVGSAILLLFADLSTASLLFIRKDVVKKRVVENPVSPPTKVAEYDTPVSTEFTLSSKPVRADVPASKPFKTCVTIPSVPAVAKPKETLENDKAGQDNLAFSEKL